MNNRAATHTCLHTLSLHATPPPADFAHQTWNNDPFWWRYPIHTDMRRQAHEGRLPM